MWLETYEEGWLNTDHIVMLGFKGYDPEGGRGDFDFSIVAYMTTGEEFLIIDAYRYKIDWCDDESKKERVEKYPVDVIMDIHRNILNKFASGTQVIDLKDVVMDI